MALDIVVPSLGESIVEAVISRWYKKAGDGVNTDEVVAELETEKVTVEVTAPKSGVISKLLAEEGSEVNVGAVIAQMEEGAAPAAKADTKADSSTKADSPAKAAAPAAPTPPAPIASGGAVKSAPTARNAAKAANIDIAAVPGTAKRGVITAADVQNFVNSTSGGQNTPLPPRSPDPRGEEIVKMTRLRQSIARRLKEAQNTAAMLTTFNEVDLSNLIEIRTRYKQEFEKKYQTRLGFMSFFVRAAVQALKEFPAVNAEIYGDHIVYKNYYDIGVAVGTEQGLVVPVLRDADNYSMADIEAGIADFGKRARDGKLTIDEMTGGTFTITNGGVFGSLLSTPILNPPQSAILGMHKIQKRPIVKGDEIKIGNMMYLAMSYDHRIIDGREAVSFLVRIRDMLEDPSRLLIAI